MSNKKIIIEICNEIERFKTFARELEKEGRPIVYILNILKQHIEMKLRK